ncbi:hypothetical protein [Saliphagus infecundisoli]|uniref:Uncharacterized protein n=1 Tax=Saliphagus infecundisoli TaxID=1849069 RepID=A0ABD5QBZ7_9EURY|nr:hypothetical protein [Saliphagus infecundisoli]
MGRAGLAFAVYLVVAGVLATAVVAGAPPPEQLCGVCGPSTANDAEIAGARGPGTLDVYIDDDGDSRWQATVPVAEDAAERYRTDGAALEAAVEDAWARHHVAAGDVRTVESRVAEGAVVVNYTVDDVAEPGVGDAWIVDYFATGASPTRYEMVVERVTIHAPARAVVTNDPAGAAVEGNAATWTREGEVPGGFDEQTYVTYGGDGPFGSMRGYATLAAETGPTALDHGVRGGVVPAVVLVLAGIGIGHTRFGRDAFDAATLERLIVAVGIVGAAGFFVVGAVTTAGGLAPELAALASLSAGYALLGSGARRLARFGTRGLVGLAVLATVVAAGIAHLLAGPVYATPLAFGLATALYLPIGHAAERGRTPVAIVALAALAPIAAVAAVAPVYVLGFGPAVYGLLLMPWIAVVVAFGYPVALLGRRLAHE